MTRSTDQYAVCFGKLPVAGDFIRGDGAAKAVATIDAWVQEGLYAAKQSHGDRWGPAFLGAAPTHLLWREGGTLLAGCWWPSRDSAGRLFPFVIGAVLSDVKPADYPVLPMAMEAFFADATALWNEGWSDLNAAGCAARVRELSFHYDPGKAAATFDEQLGAAPAATVLSDLDGAVHPASLLAEVMDVAGGSRSMPGYCLRWPVLEGSVGACFWLTALRELGVEEPKLVMWDAQPGRGAKLRLAWTKPSARTFAGMVVSDLDDDDAYDVGCREVAGGARYDPVVGSETVGEALSVLRGGC